MKTSAIKKLAGFLYAAIIILLSCLFFTNDFWLVDLRKTSVVIGMGIDKTQDGVEVTAQLAVPKSTEEGGSVQFACVSGEGETVAAALRDVNSKTGFYPKLVFCKLIVLGESCLDGDIFSYLDYFYRNEYTGLTPRVAACKGAAADVFSVRLPFGDGATDAVDRLLSKEAQRAGVAVSVNLKDVGTARKGAGGATVMPYIERSGSGVEDSGEDGSSSAQNDGEGGGSGTKDDAVFSCGKTAYFSDGYFKGVLDEEHTLALNLLKGDVRHVFISCGDGEKKTVLGLRACKGDIKAKESETSLSFSAVAQVQDETEETFATSVASSEDISLGERKIKSLIEELFSISLQSSCDFLAIGERLSRSSPSYFSTYSSTYLSAAPLTVTVSLTPSG